MNPRRIDDVLRGEIPGAELPDPGDGYGWLRFPCPFCGKPRAAVNYTIGMFVCHHGSCGERRWARPDDAGPGEYLKCRYEMQIRQAVKNVRRRYGGWIKGEDVYDLWQHAWLMLAEYDETGQLDDWESEVNGDPNQLDRYVLNAVNCDLMDWAKKLYRRKRGEYLSEPDVLDRTQLRSADESPEDIAMWINWPTLEMLIKDRMTEQEIAAEMGVSVRTVKRRAAEEKAEAREFYVTTLL